MSFFKQINIKALAAGSITIIFLGLVAQLIFLLLAVYHTELTRAYPGLSMPLNILSYVVGIMAFFVIMATGGYIAANLAPKLKLLHGILIGILTTSLSLISSLNENGFTLMALIFLVSGTGFAVVGVIAWQKLHLDKA